MITAREQVNKILHDPNEDMEDYEIIYINLGREDKLTFDSLYSLEGNFMVINQHGRIANVPVHRIRKFIKNGEIVWQRKGTLV